MPPGDNEDIALLYEVHAETIRERIRQKIFRLNAKVDASTVDDILQDTFECYLRIPADQRPVGPLPYLIKIAQNRVIQQLTRSPKFSTPERLDSGLVYSEDLPDPGPDARATDPIEGLSDRMDLDRARQVLKGIEQDVFAAAMEGLPVRETQKLLNVDRQRFYYLLRRAAGRVQGFFLSGTGKESKS